MFEITVDIRFCYGHRLIDGYKGKCSNIHGHNGVARIYIRKDVLNEFSFVHDFSDVKDIVWKWIEEHWDHGMLVNKKDRELIDFLKMKNQKVYLFNGNPSAENMAKELYDKGVAMKLPIHKIELFETPSSSAVYFEEQ